MAGHCGWPWQMVTANGHGRWSQQNGRGGGTAGLASAAGCGRRPGQLATASQSSWPQWPRSRPARTHRHLRTLPPTSPAPSDTGGFCGSFRWHPQRRPKKAKRTKRFASIAGIIRHRRQRPKTAAAPKTAESPKDGDAGESARRRRRRQRWRHRLKTTTPAKTPASDDGDDA